MKNIFGAFTVNLAVLMVLSSAGCAQEHGADHKAEKKADRSPRRLESVTWSSIKHELTWVVSSGDKKADDGSYKPLNSNTYVINMDKATMTFNGETRGFSKEEAVNVHALMDIVAKYAIESTIWWDQGNGQKLDKDKGTGVTRVAREPSAEHNLQDLMLRLELLEKKIFELERNQSGSQHLKIDSSAPAARLATYRN